MHPSNIRAVLNHYIGVAADAIIVQMEEGYTLEYDGLDYHLRNGNNVRVRNISRDIVNEVSRRRSIFTRPLSS